MKSDPTPYELEPDTDPYGEFELSELEPYEKLHPYELATLAARIAPHLCAKHSTQLDAVHLATALIQFSSRVLNEIAAERASKITAIEQHDDIVRKPEEAFRECYKLGKTNIAYRRAALLVTGHAEDRHTAVALREFQKVMDTPDPSDFADPDGQHWEKVRTKTLARYHDKGVPVSEVLSWRRKAESLDICSKKLLTRHLWKAPTKLQDLAKDNAQLMVKGAGGTSKPARRPTKKRGKGP